MNSKSNMGYVQKATGDYRKAINYYQKSLAISRQLNDTIFTVYNLTFIAGTYLEEDRSTEAFPYLEDAQKISEQKSGDSRQELEMTYYELANYYRSISDFVKGMEYAYRSRKYSEDLQNIETLVANYTLAAKCFLGLEQYNKALQEAQKGIRLAKEKNVDVHLIELYDLAAQIAEKQRDFTAAYKFHQQYTAIKDSVFNEKKSQQLQELQTRYETQLKEEKIKDLEQAKRIEELEVEALQRQQFMLGLVFLAAIIGGAWFVNQRQLRLKLEAQEKERARQLSELKAIRSQMNPHFVFNALNSIQDFILLSEKENAQHYLSKFAVLMRGFLESSRKEKVSLSAEVALLESYIELEGLRLGDEFEFEMVLPLTRAKLEEIEIPPFLLQPYVENAFKHGLFHKKGDKKLTLHFEEVSQQDKAFVKLRIVDNGVGREKSVQIQERKNNAHKPFATQATAERLKLLKSQAIQDIEIQITDLQDNVGNTSGTQVTILIPAV